MRGRPFSSTRIRRRRQRRGDLIIADNIAPKTKVFVEALGRVRASNVRVVAAHSVPTTLELATSNVPFCDTIPHTSTCGGGGGGSGRVKELACERDGKFRYHANDEESEVLPACTQLFRGDECDENVMSIP